MCKEGYIQMYRLLYGLDQPMKTCSIDSMAYGELCSVLKILQLALSIANT